MESTKTKRVWHKGPPPHVGWWNASAHRFKDTWRWWDGTHWSTAVTDWVDSTYAGNTAAIHTVMAGIKWNDYYPKNARVPRIDPRQS